MIVYIVTSEISTKGPRNINGVFATKEQAENFCAICEEVCLDDMMQIEEWDTEGVYIDCKREVKIEWTMTVKPDGEVRDVSKRFTFHDVDRVNGDDADTEGWFIRKTLRRDIPEDQAKENLLKRLAEWKNKDAHE